MYLPKDFHPECTQFLDLENKINSPIKEIVPLTTMSDIWIPNKHTKGISTVSHQENVHSKYNEVSWKKE
jgi:hypothetical protein